MMAQKIAGRPALWCALDEAGFRLEEDATNTYISAVLTPESQRLLLERIPPVHPTVYAHHVTIAFKPDAAMLEQYLPRHGERIRIPVTGWAADDKAQAALVGADSQNDYPHITISVAEAVLPAYSNELLAKADFQHVPIFTLEGVITVEALEECQSLRDSADPAR